MTQRQTQRLPGDPGLPMTDMGLGLGQQRNDEPANHCHRRRHPEQPGKTEGTRQQGADDHGHGKGEADAHPDQRHRLGPVLLAGQVGQQRHHRGGDRAGSLQHPPRDHAPDAVGHRRQNRAGGEDRQTEIDDRQAPDAVRENTEGNLQQRLGQTIGTYGKADQGRRSAFQVHAVGCQHGQNHEHAEHAKSEHQRQPGSCAFFAGAHALAVGVLHGGSRLYEPAAILAALPRSAQARGFAATITPAVYFRVSARHARLFWTRF